MQKKTEIEKNINTYNIKYKYIHLSKHSRFYAIYIFQYNFKLLELRIND